MRPLLLTRLYDGAQHLSTVIRRHYRQSFTNIRLTKFPKRRRSPREEDLIDSSEDEIKEKQQRVAELKTTLKISRKINEQSWYLERNPTLAKFTKSRRGNSADGSPYGGSRERSPPP